MLQSWKSSLCDVRYLSPRQWLLAGVGSALSERLTINFFVRTKNVENPTKHPFSRTAHRCRVCFLSLFEICYSFEGINPFLKIKNKDKKKQKTATIRDIQDLGLGKRAGLIRTSRFLGAGVSLHTRCFSVIHLINRGTVEADWPTVWLACWLSEPLASLQKEEKKREKKKSQTLWCGHFFLPWPLGSIPEQWLQQEVTH